MRQLRAPQFAEKFLHQHGGLRAVFEVRMRDLEVARIGQAVTANGAEVRQAQYTAVVLANIAARRAVEQLDAEFQATGQDNDLLRFDLQQPQFAGDAQSTLLRHHQPLAVGIEECPLHGAVGRVDVDAYAFSLFGTGSASQGVQTVDEVSGFSRNVERVPAQAIWSDRALLLARDLSLKALITRMRGGRLDAVKPGAPGFGARYGGSSYKADFPDRGPPFHDRRFHARNSAPPAEGPVGGSRRRHSQGPRRVVPRNVALETGRARRHARQQGASLSSGTGGQRLCRAGPGQQSLPSGALGLTGRPGGAEPAGCAEDLCASAYCAARRTQRNLLSRGLGQQGTDGGVCRAVIGRRHPGHPDRLGVAIAQLVHGAGV
uniref:Uncharacterized protein n=1 Tax=Tanacetum cinerariifolium TaxID=118510 RepID=A0A699JDE0_TANCI|nr:hypothetical protein [Tanacetum cinerariifolium]